MQIWKTSLQKLLSRLLAQAACLSITASGWSTNANLHSQCAHMRFKTWCTVIASLLGRSPSPADGQDNCQSAVIISGCLSNQSDFALHLQHLLISRKVTKQRLLLLPPEHWLASYQLPPQPSLRASRLPCHVCCLACSAGHFRFQTQLQ